MAWEGDPGAFPKAGLERISFMQPQSTTAEQSHQVTASPSPAKALGSTRLAAKAAAAGSPGAGSPGRSPSPSRSPGLVEGGRHGKLPPMAASPQPTSPPRGILRNAGEALHTTPSPAKRRPNLHLDVKARGGRGTPGATLPSTKQPLSAVGASATAAAPTAPPQPDSAEAAFPWELTAPDYLRRVLSLAKQCVQVLVQAAEAQGALPAPLPGQSASRQSKALLPGQVKRLTAPDHTIGLKRWLRSGRKLEALRVAAERLACVSVPPPSVATPPLPHTSLLQQPVQDLLVVASTAGAAAGQAGGEAHDAALALQRRIAEHTESQRKRLGGAVQPDTDPTPEASETQVDLDSTAPLDAPAPVSGRTQRRLALATTAGGS